MIEEPAQAYSTIGALDATGTMDPAAQSVHR
jgi:hypothetical protein